MNVVENKVHVYKRSKQNYAQYINTKTVVCFLLATLHFTTRDAALLCSAALLLPSTVLVVCFFVD